MRRVALATVILSAIALTALAQTPRDTPAAPAATAVIRGRVLIDATGDPLPNARITVTPSEPGASVVLSDREGRFALVAKPGPLKVTASKTGYARRDTSAVSADQPIEIRLSRGAVIAGHIVDQFGDPAVGTRVVAEVVAQSPAKGFVGLATAFTDDRGDYRMGSLAAGTVIVSVTTFGAPVREDLPGGGFLISPAMTRTYYPGTTTLNEAQTFLLHPGDEHASIDFNVLADQSASTMIMAPALARPPAADAPPRTGMIRGRVTSTDGRPVAHAEVWTLAGDAVPPPPNTQVAPGTFARFNPAITTADDSGQFEFRELPAGSFTLSARKPGYSMPGEEAGFSPLVGRGLPIKLADGETHEHADISLARWGSLEGHVTDEFGDPLQGVSVQLLQVRYQAGRRRLVPAGGAARLTDDLGRFRAYGLAPGRYIVSGSVGDVSSAELPGYTRSYYPGTPDASQAQFVSVGLSQQMTGADFSLTRTRTATLSGTLLNAAGEPSTTGSVKLLPSQRSAAVTSVSVGARLLPDGRFEFPNVTPGQYVIQVDRGRQRGMDGEFGVLPVSVDGADIAGLTLQTSLGSSISGRVIFDAYNGGTVPAPSQVQITPVPADPDQSPSNPGSAEIHTDWGFEITGVNGPRRLQVTRAPAGWAMKEIRVRGIDVTDRAIAFGAAAQSLADVEVVLTDRITQISGSINDDHAKPSPGSHLVLFSMDRDRWYPASRYLRTTVAKADGTIAISGLPPGSYYAVAVAQLPADGDDAWQEPAYLESLMPRAASIALGDGQQVLTLKLADK